MSKKIIISGKERILNPFISSLLSLLATGAGEIYSGSPQKGVILSLARAACALIIPFYTLIYSKNSYINEVFFSILFFILITVFSPFNALIISLKKKKIMVNRLSSSGFTSLFVIFNIMITTLSVMVFLTFFSLTLIRQNYPPIIQQGDITVIKKSESPVYRKGDMVVLNDADSSYVRIIGEPEEDVSYIKGRFSVDGSELVQSIFSDKELKIFSLTDLDVISETSNDMKYPVKQNKDLYKMDTNLKKNEYLAAPDNRNDTGRIIIVKKENISGRLEGILFSINRAGLAIKPSIKSE